MSAEYVRVLGKVVEKWEPFFSEGFGFEDVANSPTGQSVQMHHDARGRTVRTVRPDGGENRVVFGVPGSIGAPDITTPGSFEPTPWERYTYDASDNAGRTPVDAPTDHHDTPTSVVFDAKGRTVKTVERNGRSSADELVTETDYDIRGNVTKVTDPEGRDAAIQVFDLADNKLRTESIDAGNSISVFDAAGISIETRDAKGGLNLKRADNLGRTTHVWGRDNTGESVRLCERVIFGDASGGPSSPKANNHLGKPYRHYDEAGRVNFVSYDFKCNQIEQTRRVIDPQHMIDAYNAADSSNNWEVDTYRVDWTTSSGQTLADRASQLLKSRDYTVTKAYDGLDRARQIQYPADKNGDRATASPAYNKAGNLQSVTLDGNAYVERIAYNPRGQRILAALGNGAMVRYEYDDVTFRLERLRSEGYTKPDQATYSPDGPVHQDFTYSYDAAGNITQLDSDSADVGVGGTDHLQRVFEYDPIYRLTKATGREYSATKTYPWDDNGGNSDDPTQTHDYTELYEYDDVGNMTKLTHQYDNNTGTWTREFSHETASNQLHTMNDGGGTTRSYTYDAAGNLTAENTNRKHEWDWGGRMRSFRDQPPGSQATVFAHYTYDSGGQRTQKVVCKDNDDPVHTVYIGGIYEHHEQISSGSVTAENNFLHVMDDSRRVAIKRIGAHLDGANPASIQYHLGDHLQSSSVVLDGSGTFVNREEYRPYGETSFGSYKKKRYRFTGQERDEESGLNYHGARYYAPWAAKWTAPDPKGMVDAENLYVYGRNAPTSYYDPNGTQSESAQTNNEQQDSSSEADSNEVLTIQDLMGLLRPEARNKIKSMTDKEFRKSVTIKGAHTGHEKRKLISFLIGNTKNKTYDDLKPQVTRVGVYLSPFSNTILLSKTLASKLNKYVKNDKKLKNLGEGFRKTVYEEIYHAADAFQRVKSVDFKGVKDSKKSFSNKLGSLWLSDVSSMSEREYVKRTKQREREAKKFAHEMTLLDVRESLPKSDRKKYSDEVITKMAKNQAEAEVGNKSAKYENIARQNYRKGIEQLQRIRFRNAVESVSPILWQVMSIEPLGGDKK